MQMICEAYALHEATCSGSSRAEIGDDLRGVERGRCSTRFLIEITADILQQKDPVTGKPFVDIVLDTAGQKGTGKWTSVNALDMGVPAPTIAEAVFARCYQRDQGRARGRVARCSRARSQKYSRRARRRSIAGDPRRALLLEDLLVRAGLPADARGAEGVQVEAQLRRDRPDLARRLHHPRALPAEDHRGLSSANPELANLLLDPYFNETDREARRTNWRKVVALARASTACPVPTFSSALAYYDSYRSARLPANLLQAQRDFFGAHTYERIDQPRGKFFHLDWPDPKRPQIDVYSRRLQHGLEHHHCAQAESSIAPSRKVSWRSRSAMRSSSSLRRPSTLPSSLASNRTSSAAKRTSPCVLEPCFQLEEILLGRQALVEDRGERLRQGLRLGFSLKPARLSFARRGAYRSGGHRCCLER